MPLGKPFSIRLDTKIEQNLRNEAARKEVNFVDIIREIIENDQRYIADFEGVKGEINALRDLVANEDWVDTMMSVQIELLLIMREVTSKKHKESVEGLMELMGIEKIKVEV